ncbi:hypothetical protein SK128_006338, partial [Halocaridina rubra]
MDGDPFLKQGESLDETTLFNDLSGMTVVNLLKDLLPTIASNKYLNKVDSSNSANIIEEAGLLNFINRNESEFAILPCTPKHPPDPEMLSRGISYSCRSTIVLGLDPG